MIAGIDLADAACTLPLLIASAGVWASLKRDQVHAFLIDLRARLASHRHRPGWAYKRAARRARAQAPSAENLPESERDQRAFRRAVSAALDAPVPEPQRSSRD